jgi:hypothetical protein
MLLALARVRSRADLNAIGKAVAVGVLAARIGVVAADLGAVAQTVCVAVLPAGIGAVAVLAPVAKTIVIGIPPCRLLDRRQVVPLLPAVREPVMIAIARGRSSRRCGDVWEQQQR